MSKERERKIRSSATYDDLNEPWKVWVYMRYLCNEILYFTDGRTISSGKRIYLRPLLRDVVYQFDLPNWPSIEELKKIRGTAYSDRRKRREGLPLIDVARERGVRLETIWEHLGEVQ